MKLSPYTHTQILCVAVALVVLPVVAFSARGGEPLPVGQARLILRLDPDNSPEGIAVAVDGTIYVGNRYPTAEGLGAEILRIGDDGHVSVLTTFAPTASPLAFGILGLALDAGGDVYTALHTLDARTHGVWRISKNGQQKSRLAGSEAMFIPNGLTFDDRGNLYATDSVGAVWRFRPESRDEPGVVWAVHLGASGPQGRRPVVVAADHGANREPTFEQQASHGSPDNAELTSRPGDEDRFVSGHVTSLLGRSTL